MLSCSQPVVQAYERLPITKANISCFQSAGIAARNADNHLWCNHALDWLPYLPVMSVFGVWSAAAMLPQQPYSRSSAWYTVDPPGHGDAGCARYEQRDGQERMR
ncbi:MAG: hypothetical protein D6716_04580 [Chloroflexi bacterium]|nr:MAG: hypothetical protein D6716_04580 [Chloroflexota bacterium]